MITAFLQNAWFKPGTKPRTIQQYHTNIEFRRRVLAQSRSGNRLYRNLGEPLFSSIWWDNTTRETGDESSAAFLPDDMHIGIVLAQQEPKLVLTFGKIAQDALERLWPGSIIAAPHPASRLVTNSLICGIANIVAGEVWKRETIRVRLNQARGSFHCVPLDAVPA